MHDPFSSIYRTFVNIYTCLDENSNVSLFEKLIQKQKIVQQISSFKIIGNLLFVVPRIYLFSFSFSYVKSTAPCTDELNFFHVRKFCQTNKFFQTNKFVQIADKTKPKV